MSEDMDSPPFEGGISLDLHRVGEHHRFKPFIQRGWSKSQQRAFFGGVGLYVGDRLFTLRFHRN